MTAIFDKVDKQEIITDTAGIFGLDLADNLSFSGDRGFIAGVGVANVVWQGYGRNLVARKLQPITVKDVLTGTAEAIAEKDISYIPLKGVIYTTSIYLTSMLVNGVENRRPLINCILDGFVGGQLGGYLIRNAKPPPS